MTTIDFTFLDKIFETLHSSNMENNFLSPELLLPYIDFTELNSILNAQDLKRFCELAEKTEVAAVCIYPESVAEAKSFLSHSSVKLATVANFPDGVDNWETISETIKKSIANGADEIDVVIPYQHYLISKDADYIMKFVQACKKLLPNHSLKVILETGAFSDKKMIFDLALASLKGGADFLKTSTGKVSAGASLEAAGLLLYAIKTFGVLHRGLKVSGGVREYLEAKKYYLLTEMMMGKNWITKNTFRIGSSNLVHDIQTMMVV